MSVRGCGAHSSGVAKAMLFDLPPEPFFPNAEASAESGGLLGVSTDFIVATEVVDLALDAGLEAWW